MPSLFPTFPPKCPSNPAFVQLFCLHCHPLVFCSQNTTPNPCLQHLVCNSLLQSLINCILAVVALYCILCLNFSSSTSVTSLTVWDLFGIPHSAVQGTTGTQKFSKCMISTYWCSKKRKGPTRRLCIKMFKIVNFIKSKKKMATQMSNNKAMVQ